MHYLAVALCLTACARADTTLPNQADAPGQPGIDASRHDGQPGQSDAPIQAGMGTQVLLSEVVLAPSGAEFIEIANPTSQAVDLAQYFLADNGNYFKLPAATPSLTVGDFIVRFKPGSNLAAGAVATVAIGSGSLFMTAYGSAPTYSIADATMTTIASSGTPSLTDSGEIVVLFQWDGLADLVKDVDIMIVGMPTSGNTLVTKSGYVQGSGTYAADANTITAQTATPPFGKSTKRIALETGHETQNGSGNGITGDDETSEATGSTWDAVFTAPTPGQVPPALQ